ncbi:MAG: isoleucine--tRNA ligase [Defluviitaleaceae bacterium]|nr:isoleucine--tRNA ligase [Defluviitaleaceae bacterium]
MYKKVETDLKFAGREIDILNFWEKAGIFEKTIENRAGGEDFSFYEGPPTANGQPHIGHIITRAVKDCVPRYKTMKGYRVRRKAGWDTHGLPVELEVEKMLGISGKEQIEEYGVSEFIAKCKESVWKYKDEWERMSRRVGFWLDMENPYVTYDNNYIESVWWALKSIWDKGLLYKGHKILPYCSRCGTSLSSHEVAQGYKDIEETSAIARFRVVDRENEWILAWTTTPWTLPSNVALAVNGNEDYVRAKLGDDTYILAAALAENVLGEGFEILETIKGADLERLAYEPLFDFQKAENSHYVVCDNYVTLTDGTGVVHIAPAFGDDDNRIGRKYELPFVQLVNPRGELMEPTPWAGVFVKEADPAIVRHLKETGRLFKPMKISHNYPFCWRCDTPLLYYAREAWFIEMSRLREQLLANNEKINWMPENVKNGRFGNFLDGVHDWSLSRERYWGTPLPIWECECGHALAVGSIAEMAELAGQDLADIDLHKPAIDAVFLDCPKCAAKMRRVSEVIDCWFDSGSMPFAQHHYPFENQEIFNAAHPADFISEGVDQTRGWFYTLHAISTLLFEKPAYKNVISLGLTLDDQGQKMSKSKGNAIPWTIMDDFGADVVRWYFFTANALWLPFRLGEEALREAQRKFLATFWNTYAFYVLYAEIDQFNPFNYDVDPADLPVMDKWILSKLNSLVKFTDEGLGEYRITESARAIEDFTEDLSNWYVRRSRDRFWGNGIYDDKIHAYTTLHTVLTTLAKLTAPFIPFMSESIYQNLVAGLDNNAPESVHLCDYPAYDAALIDEKLERAMDGVLNIVVAGRSGRNVANIKNRQPLGRMFVTGDEPDAEFIAIIKDELNIKEIIFTDNLEEFASYSFKPQLKTLGPKFGKILPKIGAALSAADGAALMADLRQNGKIELDIDGEKIQLTEPDLLIEAAHAEGYITQQGRGITAVLDTTLTDQLIEEGFVREIISKLQTMRKEAGFEITDRIRITYESGKTIDKIIRENADFIASEVLADSITKGVLVSYFKDWNINGEDVGLSVVRV